MSFSINSMFIRLRYAANKQYTWWIHNGVFKVTPLCTLWINHKSFLSEDNTYENYFEKRTTATIRLKRGTESFQFLANFSFLQTCFLKHK